MTTRYKLVRTLTYKFDRLEDLQEQIGHSLPAGGTRIIQRWPYRAIHVEETPTEIIEFQAPEVLVDLMIKQSLSS